MTAIFSCSVYVACVIYLKEVYKLYQAPFLVLYHGEKDLDSGCSLLSRGLKALLWGTSCFWARTHKRWTHVQYMLLILSFCHSKWQFHHLYQRQTHLISCCSVSKRNSLKRSPFSLSLSVSAVDFGSVGALPVFLLAPAARGCSAPNVSLLCHFTAHPSQMLRQTQGAGRVAMCVWKCFNTHAQF